MPKRKIAKISSSICEIEEIVPEDMKTDFSVSKSLKQLNLIKKWKIGKVADVDIYGCDTLAEPGAEPKVPWKNFQNRNFFVGEKVSSSCGVTPVIANKRSNNGRSSSTFTVHRWLDTCEYSSSKRIRALRAY